MVEDVIGGLQDRAARKDFVDQHGETLGLEVGRRTRSSRFGGCGPGMDQCKARSQGSGQSAVRSGMIAHDHIDLTETPSR
jgi:hypothetical protein